MKHRILKWNREPRRKQLMNDIKSELKRIDPVGHGQNGVDPVGAMLLAASVLGPDVKEISSVTGSSVEFIEQKLERLWETGVWRRGIVDSAAWFEEGGAMAFLLHEMVAKGILDYCAESKKFRASDSTNLHV